MMQATTPTQFQPVKHTGKLVCRANPDTCEVEIVTKIHGRRVTCIINPRTMTVRETTQAEAK